MNIQLKRWKFFRILGMLALGLSLLASCDRGSSGRDAQTQFSRLTLRLTTATESLHSSPLRAVLANQTRQAGVAARLVITVEGEGIATPITADCQLAGPPTVQCRGVTETAQASQVEVELMVPSGPGRRIGVTVFDAAGRPILHGEQTVNVTQAVEVIEISLLRLPEATALENQTFTFSDGAIFGLVGQEVRLSFGTFTDNSGSVLLTVEGRVARGTARIASIDLSFQQSEIPAIASGSAFSFDATMHEDGSLTLRNRATGISSLSTPPVTTAGADLRVEQIAIPTTVAVGEALTYLITVTNNGPTTATEATLTDTLPTAITLHSVVSTQGSCSVVGNIVRCILGDVALRASVTVTLVVTPTVVGSLITTASVTGAETDPVAANNTATTTISVSAATDADLTLSAQALSSSVAVGQALTYVLTVTNQGPAPATEVVLTETFSQVVQVGSLTPTQGSCQQPSGQVRCTLGAVPPGASVTVTLVVTPIVVGSLTTTASVTGAEPDPVAPNNTATTTISVSAATDADLTLSAQALSNSVAVGQALTYVLTVVNQGPAPATGVVLTETFSQAVLVGSPTPTQGSCQQPSGQVRCTLGAVPPGVSVVVTMSVTPTVVGSLTTTASVTGAEPDPVAPNNTATTTISVSAATDADLTLSAQALSNSVAVGQALTYVLTVTNQGPAAATGVVLTETFSQVVQVGSLTTTQGSCQQPSGQVRCTLGVVPLGASVVVTMSVTPTVVGALITTASVTGAETDPNLQNNTAPPITTMVSTSTSADLVVSSTVSGSVVAGEPLTYLLTVNNNGPAVATGVILTDTLPADAIFRSVVSTQGSCSVTAHQVSCALGRLVQNISARVTIEVIPTAAGMLTNIASVAGNEVDPDTSNNTSIVTTAVTTGTDLAVQQSALPDPGTVGQALTYLITVTNRGPTAATGVMLTDTLPAGVIFNSAVSTQDSCSQESGRVRCTLGGLAREAKAIVTIIVTPTATGLLTNTVSVTGNETDPNGANNTLTITTLITTGADVAVHQGATPSPAVIARELTYLITVTNNGPAMALNVALTNALPVGVTFGSVVPAQGSCSVVGMKVNCTLGGLAPSTSTTVTIVVTPQAVGTLVNLASAGSSTTDPNGSNNTAVLATRVSTATEADLALSRVEAPALVAPDEAITYLSVVTNNGPAVATNVVLTNALPAGVAFSSAATTRGSCSLAAGRVLCTLGTLAPGASATVTIVGMPTAVGTLFNTVSVQGSEKDPDGENNTSTRTTVVSVATAADLAVSKVALPEVATVGEPLTYLVTVTNQGPATASGVQLTDALPANVTLHAPPVPSQGTCGAFTEGRVTCDLGDLVRDASATVTLQVVSATVGNLTNTASVASTTVDPNGGNNTATVTTLVSTTTAADLAVSQMGTPDPVSVGEALIYLITVVNRGPAEATGVQLTAALPARATWQATTPSQGSCAQPTDGRVRCILGRLARGAPAAVTIVVTPTAPGTLFHTVSVTGNEDDPNGSNNTATVTTTVSAGTAADLAVSQMGTPNPVSVGGALTYLMTVVNHGPAEATVVQLTAVLPAGATVGSALASQGAGCAGNGPVHCDLGDLMPGSSATVTIVVTPTGAGTLTSTATVQGNEADPNGENNTSTITTVASAGTDVDLEVGQFTIADPVLEGQLLAYVITVRNNGPGVATGVLLTSKLPAGVTFGSATPLRACRAETGTVRCALGTLLLGNAQAATVTIVVMPTAAGTLVHTARVQGNEDDPLPGNNVSTATITVARDSDRDGLSDDREAILGTDPLKADTDGDGLSDGTEVTMDHTDPLKADTDGDGFSDDTEVTACSNPLSAKSVPTAAGPLYPGQVLDTGYGLGRIVVADVNGDGVPDLITLIPAQADVLVVLGCRHGTFRVPLSFNAGVDVGGDSGALPIAVAVADVNGDGKPDIITANAGFDARGDVLFGKGIGNITILLGNRNGTFQQAASTLAVGDAPLALAIADVNGDKKLDIITANAGSNDVTVLLGNGDGSFQSPLSFIVGTRPVAVSVADVNGDGKPDIITANSGSDDVAVLLGTAGSLFEPARLFPVGEGPAAVVVEDVDGNHTLDLVIANCGFDAATLRCTGTDPGNVAVLLGAGNGAFPTLRSFTVGMHPIGVAVAKLNADNFPDLVTVNSASNDMSILLGTGTPDPLFQEHAQSPLAVVTGPVSVAVADVNDDGVPDLIPATEFGGVGVFLGNADGTFETRRLFSPGAGLDPHALVVADVNGDDLPDIITANPDAFNVSVVLGKASGGFETPQIFMVGRYPVAVAVADINRDGFSDIITANQLSDDVSVLLGQADFGFGPARSFAAGDAPAAVVVQDINGDSRPDLIVVNSGSDDVSVRLGTGTDALFGAETRFSVGGSPVAVVVQDVNGDSRPDLIVANSALEHVSIRLGTGTGTLFGAETRFSVGTGLSPSAVAVADINGDGKPDIITANTDDFRVSVLLGKGDGTFEAPKRLFVSAEYGPRRVVVADVNADTIPDLITANVYSSAISILLGKGDGAFEPTQRFFVGSAPRDVVVQDMNSDDLLDLITIPEGVIAVLLHR